MWYLALVALGLSTLASPADQSALDRYQSLAAHTARTADAQVDLALWCEANGLDSEKLKHLARAILIDPAHAKARALLGLVRQASEWKRPTEVASDEKLALARSEYEAKRATAPRTAQGRWQLGLWCEKQGLQPEAYAHFTEVLRFDPNHEGARKRLDFKRVGNRWILESELARIKQENAAQTTANKKFLPLFAQWAKDLDSRDPATSAAAETQFRNITDPRAVPALLRALNSNDPAKLQLLVEALGQIKAPESSRLLAAMAVSTEEPEIRRLATETLRNRDPRQFAGLLVAMVQKPITYEVKPALGPGSPGVLFVEGVEYNRKRTYAVAPPRPTGNLIPPNPNEQLVWGADGLPYGISNAAILPPIGSNRARDRQNQANMPVLMNPAALPQLGIGGGLPTWDFNNALGLGTQPVFIRPLTTGGQIDVQNRQRAIEGTIQANQRLQNDIAEIEAANMMINGMNERILPVLIATTGMNLGADPIGWSDWYLGEMGQVAYRSTDKPTFTDNVRITPQYVRQSCSCFVAGTLVQTQQGPRAIESLQIGDVVLSQDPRSGALQFQPVTAVHHNPPSPTLALTFDSGETIRTTNFHPFWVAHRGWVLARDLKPGTMIRTLSGTTRLASAEPGPTQPVFNLDVAQTNSFFVGNTSLLAHDHTLPFRATYAPFDAVALNADSTPAAPAAAAEPGK